MNLITLLRRGLLAATVACAAWGAPAHAAISIDNAFFDSTLPPGWTISGAGVPLSGTGVWTPHLAAGLVPGDGWLRLTEAVDNQRGKAAYETAFSSTEGLQITFDYATYGGTGADKIAFYLVDGGANPSGSLAYTGMPNGYMAIGLDEWGNFGASAACVSPCSATRNSVVMLGAVSLGYPTLKRVVLPSAFPALGQIATGSRAGARTVRVTISPASSGVPPTVTVEIDPGTGFVKVIDAFSLAGNGPVPAVFKMGFTARTGGENNIHEVRVRSAKTLVSAVPALGESAPLGALVALLALLTLPALRWRLHS